MKVLSRLSIISILLSVSSLVFVYAADDCEIFVGGSYRQEGGDNGFQIVNETRETNNNYFAGFLSIDQQKAIITKNDLNTAVLNLKKYCCNRKEYQNSSLCENDKLFFNNNALESPYLFDHLFDVIMRRLAGFTGENDIYVKTNMTVDSSGAERRNRINSKAESLSGASPQTIFNKYKEFWNKSNPELGFDITKEVYNAFSYDNDNFLNIVKTDSKISDALKKYNEWTLYDKYYNSCALAEFLYSTLNRIKSDAKTETISRLTKNNSCDIVVKNQINNENTYVQIVSRRAANLFLTNYIEGYISYLFGRQQNLEKTWNDSANRFLDVARATSCLQSKCTY